ncbi:hypothetical protein BJ912DRAFT_512566 [Pholiota molesta]|nr:hypothetical protein BJ912DRAFT_512566 [Pholiota molesta]
MHILLLFHRAGVSYTRPSGHRCLTSHPSQAYLDFRKIHNKHTLCNSPFAQRRSYLSPSVYVFGLVLASVLPTALCTSWRRSALFIHDVMIGPTTTTLPAWHLVRDVLAPGGLGIVMSSEKHVPLHFLSLPHHPFPCAPALSSIYTSFLLLLSSVRICYASSVVVAFNRDSFMVGHVTLVRLFTEQFSFN